jgi:hypothetical protein
MDVATHGAEHDGWRCFAEDAVVEDPVGPSHFDPDGTGHRGSSAISAFWDKAIALAERFEFDIVDSSAGSEAANVRRRWPGHTPSTCGWCGRLPPGSRSSGRPWWPAATPSAADRCSVSRKRSSR